MTRQEHDAQRRAVRASLLLAENRTDRHEIIRRAELKPCPRCGQPRGLIFCPKCMEKAA